MKIHEKIQTGNHKNPKHLKQKLMAALAMLLVSTLLMTTTSYAWLVMSVAPEVTGISTNIGANGSLEIALLNTTTRQDLSAIGSTMGQSLVNDKVGANYTWGNLIDLSDKGYGLGNITLLPARLQAVSRTDGEGYTVNSGLLAVPTYGYDGRVIDVSNDTVSAIYKNSEFSFVLGLQDYGVRAVGTSNSLTAQAAALAMAKSNIVTYTNSAAGAAESAFENNGVALMDIVIAHASSSSNTYNDEDLDSLKAMLDGLQSSLNYINLALRQGAVAVVASQLADEDQFTTARDYVIDVDNSWDEIAAELETKAALPEAFDTWIDAYLNTQSNLNGAIAKCVALSDAGAPYTWDQIKAPMDSLLNMDAVYLNDKLLSEFSASDAGALFGTDVSLLLAPGSGVIAEIADFTGNLEMWISCYGMDINVKTAVTLEVPYLSALSAHVSGLEAAEGDSETGTVVEMTTTYGYALDMAFRCNATGSDLLLQTSPEQRIYGESNSASTMGGGSYMEFATEDKDLSLENILLLMDAVRVGFMDDQGNLLKVAKLNVSNRTVLDGIVKAPLYLYEYSFQDDGAGAPMLVMGERQKTDNVITKLEQSVAKAVTAVVWLDGDMVDNTMVSATEEMSLTGMLNLQFASSANLVPADNDALLGLTSDKSDLAAAVEAEAERFASGQGLYTTVSWKNYASAYAYASKVNLDANANDTQIYNAALELALAKTELEMVSKEALQAKISEIREFMGETDDLARYVIKDSNGNYVGIDPYTEEQKENRVQDVEIYRVDYTNNLNDEGNGLMTPIYNDESWTALAAALYAAEVVEVDPNAGDEAIDGALTALVAAHEGLVRAVYYLPYEYRGILFYYAISEETDTYGKWYDSDCKRIVSDRMILELDAYAEPADIAAIEMDNYIPYDAESVSPSIILLDKVYTELQEDKIIALNWNVPSLFEEYMTQAQIVKLTSLVARAEALGLAGTEVESANALLKEGAKESTSDVQTVIDALQTKVVAAEGAKAEEDAANAPDPEYMTEEQRYVLNAAVKAAKTLAGYGEDHTVAEDASEAEKAQAQKMIELEAKVAEAEMMVADSTTAYDKDNTILNELNEYLEYFGETKVTEYNTLPIKIPVGSELYDIVYTVESANSTLYLTGETGVTTVNALILTEDGIIYTVEKAVNIYVPAEGVELTGDTSVAISGKGALKVELISESEENPHGETIKSCSWSSSDLNVLKFSGNHSGTCSIEGVKSGEAVISVTVETTQGNTYSASFAVSVN